MKVKGKEAVIIKLTPTEAAQFLLEIQALWGEVLTPIKQELGKLGIKPNTRP